MDRHSLAMLIPVLGVLFTGLTIFSFTPLGRAIARRLSGASPALEDRVGELEEDIEAARRELAGMHERLDFAERTLAQVREPRRIPDR